jgi:hypothetical protein
MLVSYKTAQPQKLPKEHEGKSEAELNIIGFVICPPKPETIPGQTLWWENNDWVIKEPTEGELAIQWQSVRNRRNNLLAESDVYIVKAKENNELADVGVIYYRKTLRNITEQDNPFAIDWPEQPVYIDGRWVKELITPTIDSVNQERDRRINSGFVWNGNKFQSDKDSRENMAGAATSAIGYMAAGGDPTSLYWASETEPFGWIAENNDIIPLSAIEVVDMANTAMAHKKRAIFMARELKNMDAIPDNFKDDKYW